MRGVRPDRLNVTANPARVGMCDEAVRQRTAMSAGHYCCHVSRPLQLLPCPAGHCCYCHVQQATTATAMSSRPLLLLPCPAGHYCYCHVQQATAVTAMSAGHYCYCHVQQATTATAMSLQLPPALLHQQVSGQCGPQVGPHLPRLPHSLGPVPSPRHRRRQGEAQHAPATLGQATPAGTERRAGVSSRNSKCECAAEAR